MSDIVIIGGGVAGLTAGICALLNGFDAVIYEKHHIAGGNLTGWDRGGYHIDNCVHWLTGTNPVTTQHELWVRTGALGDTAVFQAESLYTYEHGGMSLSLSRDVNRLHADMLALSPRDDREIASFIKALNAAKTIVEVSGKNNNKRCTTPELLASLPILLRYHRMTTHELGQRFAHPVIQGFMECLFPASFGALGLLVAAATFCADNGGIPQGGSLAMAQRMTERFLSLGGVLHCGVCATGIQFSGCRAVSVRTDRGETVRADEVILAVDPAYAFGRLLDKDRMPLPLKKLYEHPKVSRFSSFHCAFACDLAAPPFCGDRMIEFPEPLRQKLRSRYLILREYSHEDGFAPDGKSLIQAMHYCTEEECRFFIRMRERPAAYRALKEEIAGEIAALITARFPELSGRLRCIDTWTPATYKRFTGADVGSYMGFAFPPKLNPVFMNGRIKGLENVTLATQWQQAPGGLPVAAKAGEAAVREIIRRRGGG
ncbi:MAG: NAD(P)/FAD-dependent oxidoreductase [Ruminococcus sp.]|nr:NAD(P)/FAD-dependent oxidoreductase [Ruminococcus sp.]